MGTTRVPPILESVAKALGVAAGYFVFGKLALLLAIPPGYASAVFPSAGLAIAAVLLFGNRIWPAILLGSFVLNVSVSPGETDLGAIARFLPPVGIGAGAAAQAVLGALGIKRLVGFPRSFDQPGEFLRATLIAGPVSCLVSATVGISVLLASDGITADRALRAWSTWWLGDTLGVLLVFPIVSAWCMEHRRARKRMRLLVAGPLLLGTLLAIALFFDARKTEQRSAQLEFERRAEIMAQTLQQSSLANLDIVRSTVGLFNSTDGVNRSEFQTFVGPLLETHADLHGLSWNVRVSADRRAFYEQAARRDGFPDFEITEQDGKGRLVRAGMRGEYIPVYFIEPYETNEGALGFDLASDPTRVEVMMRVRDSGELLATPPLTLVQESGNQAGFLVFAPIYEHGRPVNTPAQRREHLQSFVSAIFRSGELAETALRAFDKEGIDYRIVDATEPGRLQRVYPEAAAPASIAGMVPRLPDGDSRLRWSTDFDLAGRRWLIDFWPTAAYQSAQPTGKPLALLTAALFFTSLLGGFLFILTGRAATIQRVVEQRTAELSTINVELSREVAERQRAEAALKRAAELLETRVDQRTEELVRANRDLRLEVQERKLAQAALGASESRFRAVFRASAIGIAIGDSEGRILDVNAYVCEMLGLTREELLGKPLDELLSPLDPDADRQAAVPDPVKPEIVGAEYRYCTPDGRVGWALMRQTPLLSEAGKTQYVLGILEDVTARKGFDEQLSKSQKLESIGLLAGGIAHDFNNLLTAIMGNLSLAREEAPPSSGMVPFLDQADGALSRAAGLTRQLLTFAIGGAPVTRRVPLEPLLQEAAVFALGGSNVRFRCELPGDLWLAKVDSGQLHQVVSNLLINAAQAMPEGGSVLISGRNEVVEPVSGQLLEPGEYVRISFVDHGVGIQPEVRSRVFDPYFTTKTEGSGLGLATAYSIIRRHDGDIAVESEPGVRTVFHVFLPASRVGQPEPEAGAPADTGTGKGRILIMDDEASIRNVAQAIVTRLGYDVDLARDGAEAVACFRDAADSGESFEAVILDLTIPGGMGGKDTVRKLIEIDPQVRAIVSSGYSDDPVLSNYHDYGFRGVVAKPYRIEELGGALKRILGRATDRRET